MRVWIYDSCKTKSMMDFHVFVTTVNKNNSSLFEDIFVTGLEQNQIENNSTKINVSKKSHTWYFNKSIKNQKLWNKIKKNDWCIFGIGSKYTFAGKINKKFNENKIENIIKLKLNITQPINILTFDNIIQINLNMLQTNRKFGFNEGFLKMHKISFVMIKEVWIRQILEKYNTFNDFLTQDNQISKKVSKKGKKRISNPFDSITNDEEPPKTIGSQVTRKIRNTKKTELLKIEYMNSCQICKIVLNISKTRTYSEVHHVWPLGKNGKDNCDNMLVLCPNHHAQFDSAYIGFDKNNHTQIIDKMGNKIGEINYTKNHTLNKENIIYHIKKMEKI